MKMQYSYEEVYSGNYEVTTYIDGCVEDSEIVAIYELSSYIERLEYTGYEFCYSDEEFYRVQSEIERLSSLMEKIKRKRLYHKD